MKKTLFILAILAAFISAEKKSVTLIGYIPSYRVSLMDQMDLGALTHVIAAFANPDSSGTMSCPIDLEEFSLKVRTAGSKPVISIGGGGDYSWGDKIGIYHHLYADSNRTDFVKKLANYCEKYQCAGIDLDIEGNALSHPGYNAFANELADTLHGRGLEVYGVYGVNGQWGAVNVSDTVLQKMDFIGTMSYGGVGQWNWNKPSNQCTYDRFKSDIEYFINRGVDPSKIHGGIPFYSVGFPAQQTNDLTPYYHTVDQLMNSQFYIDQNAFHVDTMKNSDGMPEFFSGFNTNKRKIDFCNSLGAGMMIWELGQDNYSGSGPNMLDSLSAYIKGDLTPTIKQENPLSLLKTKIDFLNDKLSINIPVAGNYSIIIRDLKGKIIYKATKHLSKEINLISMNNSQISKGLYIISLIGQNKVYNYGNKCLYK